MAASPEVLTRFATEPGSSPHTFDSSSEFLECYAFGVQKVPTIVFSDTIRGTRDQASERTRQGPSYVRGPISMPVDVAAMDNWLPRILGGNESADVFPVAESLPAFGLLADLGATTHEYKDCYVNSAVFSGRAYNGQGQPDPLRLQMSILGMTEATGTTFPSISAPTAANTAPLLFEDGAFTVNGSSRCVMAFSVSIHNMLQARWCNSLTPSVIYPRGRVIQVSLVVPYDSTNQSMYGQSYAGATSTITFTNGNTSFGFTFGRLQIPTQSPIVVGRGEVLLRLNGIARSITTTKSIVGANDSTV